MRYLAIDYGKRRTGLAICDADEMLASPVTVLDGSTDLYAQIHKVLCDYEVEALVVGLPFNMDGSEGPQAKEVRHFARKLAETTTLPIHFQDERLSSFAARAKRPDLRRGVKKKGKPFDALAAAEILEAFLEANRKQGESDSPSNIPGESK